jgi:hypothetical protein
MDYTRKNSAKRSFQRKPDTKAGTNETLDAFPTDVMTPNSGSISW